MAFWRGRIGSGKTTRALGRLGEWLDAGISPDEILVLLPQRILSRPYVEFLSASDLPNALDVSVLTFTGLAQRAINHYWTELAPQVMENWDGRSPTYLTIETSQYYMSRWVEPLFREGRFEAVHLERPRLITQILNNLSAAAVNGFSLDVVEQRLIKSWVGQSNRIGVYEAAILAARQFRADCDSQALLDFSRQVDLFMAHILPSPRFQADLGASYRYLIADNLEEHYPVVFDFMGQLLPHLEDALFILDEDAGYRIFLGGSPELAMEWGSGESEQQLFETSYVQSAALVSLDAVVSGVLSGEPLPSSLPTDPREAFTVEFSTFYPQMLDWVVLQITTLIDAGVSPGEIVVLSPFLGDSLRFSILNALEQRGIPFVSHRPSRSLQDEPVARAILTAMKLAYISWEGSPSRSDVTQMLVQFISGLDPIRADLLTQILNRPPKDLGEFERIVQPMQERITYVFGERYSQFRQWVLDFGPISEQTPPDHFIHLLFEFLTKEGFGFAGNLEAGRVASHLISSAAHFRSVMLGSSSWGQLSAEFIELVSQGVLAGQPIRMDQPEAVFIAPAYTFLMQNRFVDYQIWVDVGSASWVERIEQPVTHPYVLRRTYPEGEAWTDAWETETQRMALRHLVLGLTRRCRSHIYLAFSDLSEQGYEQRAYLLRLFNQLMGYYGTLS